MIQVTSFLLGVAAAWAIPTLGRVIRPLLVEAAVAGMAVFDETRRVVAEQMEVIEDMAAEARVRREESLAASNGYDAAGDDETGHDGEVAADGEPPRERVRRRGDGAGRRRTA
jgi:hypothetical protein